MGDVVRLSEWRAREVSGDVRLERAVGSLDRALARSAPGDPPAWLRGELLAIHGCISLGLLEEAAARCERLAGRCGGEASSRPPRRRRATAREGR